MEDSAVNKTSSHSWLKPFLALSILAFVFIAMQFYPPFYQVYNTLYNNVVVNVLGFFRQLSPVPLYLIFFILVFAKLAFVFLRNPFFLALQRLFSGIVKLIVLFFIVWGFHYTVTDLPQKNNSQVSDIEELYGWSTEKCNKLREELSDNNKLLSLEFPKELKEELKMSLRKEADLLDPNLRKVLWPKPFLIEGALRTVGIGGIYFPYTGEPLYDDSYLLVKKLFTYSHEFFHGIGVTGEDECNYLAFKILSASKNKVFQYAAFVDLMLTSKFLLGISNQDASASWSSQLESDILALREDNLKYKSSLQLVSSATNDIYLKMLSSEDGVDAYNMYLKWIEMN